MAHEVARQAALARGDDDFEDIEEIVEDVTVNKANSITVSKSCLGGYKSALKNYYSDHQIAFECHDRPTGSQSLDKYLDEVIVSYGNLLADKKKRAIMSINEGKSAMTDQGFASIIAKLIAYKPKAARRSLTVSILQNPDFYY